MFSEDEDRKRELSKLWAQFAASALANAHGWDAWSRAKHAAGAADIMLGEWVARWEGAKDA